MARPTQHPALRPSLSSTCALLLALAAPAACKSKDEGASDDGSKAAASADDDAGKADAGAGKTSGDPPPKSADDGDEEPDDPRAADVVIARAEAPSPTSAKGAKSLGFSLAKLLPLYALAGTAKLPDWGAVGEGVAKLARDDNLDTAWTCTHGGDKPCVFGLALPETGKVEVLRLYTAAGPRYRDYKAHPRVAKVRVHTDAGHVDVKLADGANHAYVRFDEPVETRSVAVEVLELHKGNKDQLVHIAELEVYGTAGAPRAPLELDPERAWVSWETTQWGGPEGDRVIRQLFVNFARPGQAEIDPEAGPARKRFNRATGVFGKSGDDFMLFERLYGTSCDEHRGSYMLYDRRNRMFYPLGDLGGAGAPVYRHQSGRGYAVGWASGGEFTVKGVVEEAGELVWKRPPKAGVDDAAAQLRKWGFDPTPLARGRSLERPPTGCHRAGTGELDAMVSAAKLSVGGEFDPSQWLVCELGSAKLYASATCDGPAQAYLVDGGDLVGKHESKEADARGLRLRRFGPQMLLELSAEKGDTATLYWVEADKLIELESNGGLYVRPPASCAPCEDGWQGPGGEVESESEDEGGDEEAAEGDDADEGEDEEFEGDPDEGSEPPPDEDEDEDEAPDDADAE